MTPLVTEAEFNSEVTLSCEIYGYFAPELPEIVWIRSEDVIGPDNQNSYYSISTREGNRFIQNGGSEFRASVISTLSFTFRDNSTYGIYFCQIGDKEKIFQVVERGQEIGI